MRWLDDEGLALISSCRVIHRYSAQYDKHSTRLDRQILPPDNDNFQFLPYRLDSKHWRDGSVEKIISAFGEIDICTSVCYPLQFARVLEKDEFESVMDLVHSIAQDEDYQDNDDEEEAEEQQEEKEQIGCCWSLSCGACLTNKKRQERAEKKERLHLILERDINKRPTFATKSMTMDYLSCGKLEGILLSISPWVAESGVDNRYWNGSRPMRADAVVSFEADTSETKKTTEVGERSGERHIEHDLGEEAVMVPDDTIFDTRYMCDPPTMAAPCLSAESKQSSKYAVPNM